MTGHPLRTRAFGLAIFVLSGMQLMTVLDGTVVILAVPRLQEQLGMSSAGANWVITAYGLAYAGLMLLGGRIGDAFGRKQMFLLGVAVFTVSSLLCGLAVNPGMLIAARALQGVGAALAAPTAMALVASTFAPGKARNQAIAIFGSMVGIGSIGGLVIGGALTDLWWRWVFLINVPIGALILIGAMVGLRDTAHHRLSLDVRGAVLATLGTTAVVFGGLEGPEMGWANPAIIGALVGGVALLVVFVFAERHVDNPLLPWSLFESRERLVIFAAILLASAVMGGMTVYCAQYVQNILGYSPLRAGLAFIPFTVGMGVGSTATTALAARVAPRWLITVGAAVTVAGLLYGSTLGDRVHYPTLAALFLTIGVGVGVVLVLVPLCLLVDVEVDTVGPLAAVGQMLLAFGPALALGFISPMVVSRTLSRGGTTGKPSDMDAHELAALNSGYNLALFLCAMGALLTFALALTIRYTASQVAQAHAVQEAAERG
ncbi:MAG: MFS transporter [Mycobacteriaceae bacterium]|nr:MFS transporter [Mycobacteriaceae bacterium]